MKLLVIEDNPRLADRIKNQLKKWYGVELAHSGDGGLRLIAQSSFDAILLDLNLPDASGLDICKRIRAITHDIPILILTGIDTSDSRVLLLDSGADDYVTKPFDLAELHSRINALTRRRARSEINDEIILGDLIIAPSTRTVTRQGVTISLRRKEYDILEYLALSSGRVVSRENIINHVWSATSAQWVSSIDVHIKQLRDKIDKPFGTKTIKTAYGLGYTLDVSSRAAVGVEVQL